TIIPWEPHRPSFIPAPLPHATIPPPYRRRAAMDGSAAIEQNRLALKRITLSLMAMAGLDIAAPSTSPQQQAPNEQAAKEQTMRGGRRSPDRRMGAGQQCGVSHQPSREPGAKPEQPTLPRHLWLAILRLLRPAEAAARRLIIAAARGLTVTLPPPRQRQPKP